MTAVNCLRLACRSQNLSLSATHLGQNCVLATCSRSRTSARSWQSPRAIRAQSRMQSRLSDAVNKPSRWSNAIEDSSRQAEPTEELQMPKRASAGSEEASPFRAQRQIALQSDLESEDPLFPESYPRLKHGTDVKSVPEFLEDFHESIPNERVTVSGRVKSKRVMGKGLIFVDIVNEFNSLQVMISKKRMNEVSENRAHKFNLLRNMIQVGDHISVVGVPTKTKAGQRTLEAMDLPQLLAPSLEQIPERLSDPEARMADRHLDLLVNREAVDVLRLRSEITKYMRDHFHSKRFLEFQTPILAENAGGAVARPFVTHATEFQHKDLALRVAPELWLKRLVVGGVDKVFEIGPAFRNEGIDATHNPEFTICEFYSAYSNLTDLISETEELMCGLAQHCQTLIESQLSTLKPLGLDRFVRPFKQIEFIPELEKAIGARLPKLSSPDALPELIALLKLMGIALPGEVPNSLPKLLDRLAAIYLEPMSFSEPVFITNHPACMSPLSKSFVCPQTYQLVSARAEVFFGGREIANMYEEENDPKEQKRKLIAHRHLVNKPNGELAVDIPDDVKANFEESAEYDGSNLDKDGETAPLDHSFVKALEYGLPPTGGWGCGVDRLVMLFSGANRISQCLSFGTLRHVVSQSSDGGKQAASKSVGGSGDENA